MLQSIGQAAVSTRLRAPGAWKSLLPRRKLIGFNEKL